MIHKKAYSSVEVVRTLGARFRDYRMRVRKTRKEVATHAAISMATLYRFETGHARDISISTLLRLLNAIGLNDNWEQILPELPDDPYLYNDKMKRIQRIRHPRQ